MPTSPFACSLAANQRFFATATACFSEADAGFAAYPGGFTVAQQIAHTAQTIEWFLAGMFSPTGFTTDWAAAEAKVRTVTTLAEARAWLDRAYAAAIARIDATEHAEMFKPLAPGPIMGGLPRVAVIEAIVDHTAHHRGALAVYARLRGLVPAMPYA